MRISEMFEKALAYFAGTVLVLFFTGMASGILYLFFRDVVLR